MTYQKKKNGKNLQDATKELLALADNIEVEEELTSRDGEDGETGEDDNIEGWIDERTLMDEDKLEELEESVKPVHVLLTKVSYVNIIIHNYLINKFYSATENSVCSEGLNHDHPPAVVYHS